MAKWKYLFFVACAITCSAVYAADQGHEEYATTAAVDPATAAEQKAVWDAQRKAVRDAARERRARRLRHLVPGANPKVHEYYGSPAAERPSDNPYAPKDDPDDDSDDDELPPVPPGMNANIVFGAAAAVAAGAPGAALSGIVASAQEASGRAKRAADQAQVAAQRARDAQDARSNAVAAVQYSEAYAAGLAGRVADSSAGAGADPQYIPAVPTSPGDGLSDSARLRLAEQRRKAEKARAALERLASLSSSSDSDDSSSSSDSD